MSPENGNRATVALVDAKVQTVDAKIDGLTALIEAQFADIRSDLEMLKFLTVKVDGISDRQLVLEGRVTRIEQWREAEKMFDERRKSYRSIHLPSILIALLGLLVAALALVLPNL